MTNQEEEEREEAAPAVEPPDVDTAKEALLARLGNQFGDLDISHLLQTTTDVTDNSTSGNNSIVQDESSEESSLVEPTKEELEEWQSKQFQNGADLMELRKQHTLTPIEKRRQEASSGKKAAASDDTHEWEEVHEKPNLNGKKSVFFNNHNSDGEVIVGTHPALEKLAQQDPTILGGPWKRIYSSSDGGDGLSFFSLTESILGYNGPTVMLIGTQPSKNHCSMDNKNSSSCCDSTSTIGFYTTTPWVEAYHDYGSDDCFLFTMNHEVDNEINFIKPKKNSNSKTSYMYCHPTHGIGIGGIPTEQPHHHQRRHQKPTTDGGIGIGGIDPSKQPRLHITKSLEECRALSYCPLFESKPLLPKKPYEDCLWYFDIIEIEVWGVGGTEWINKALSDRNKYKSRVQANLKRAQIVDKKQFVDDFRTGLFSTHADHNKQALFGHVEIVSERTDLCTME